MSRGAENTAELLDAAPKRSPLSFFVLLYLLSSPFWIISFFFNADGLPDSLPITDVGAVFVPAVAACVLVYREEGAGGVRRLLGRIFDQKRVGRKVWYVPVLLLMPLIYLLTYEIMRLAGTPLSGGWGISAAVIPTFLFFFIGAAAEELGYTGYATDPLQDRWGALKASLMIGVPWALWHVPSMIVLGQGVSLIVFGLMATVGWRVLYVWIYNNTGKSVFAVILFHTLGNTGRSVFPGGRQGFELGGGMVGYTLVALAAVFVAALWDSRTLTRFRPWETAGRQRT